MDHSVLYPEWIRLSGAWSEYCERIEPDRPLAAAQINCELEKITNEVISILNERGVELEGEGLVSVLRDVPKVGRSNRAIRKCTYVGADNFDLTRGLLTHNVLFHELGHSFSLMHSASLSACDGDEPVSATLLLPSSERDCSFDEYGAGAMGDSRQHPLYGGFSTINLAALGMLDMERETTVVAPLDRSYSAVVRIAQADGSGPSEVPRVVLFDPFFESVSLPFGTHLFLEYGSDHNTRRRAQENSVRLGMYWDVPGKRYEDQVYSSEIFHEEGLSIEEAEATGFKPQEHSVVYFDDVVLDSEHPVVGLRALNFSIHLIEESDGAATVAFGPLFERCVVGKPILEVVPRFIREADGKLRAQYRIRARDQSQGCVRSRLKLELNAASEKGSYERTFTKTVVGNTWYEELFQFQLSGDALGRTLDLSVTATAVSFSDPQPSRTIDQEVRGRVTNVSLVQESMLAFPGDVVYALITNHGDTNTFRVRASEDDRSFITPIRYADYEIASGQTLRAPVGTVAEAVSSESATLAVFVSDEYGDVASKVLRVVTPGTCKDPSEIPEDCQGPNCVPCPEPTPAPVMPLGALGTLALGMSWLFRKKRESLL